MSNLASASSTDLNSTGISTTEWAVDASVSSEVDLAAFPFAIINNHRSSPKGEATNHKEGVLAKNWLKEMPQNVVEARSDGIATPNFDE